MAVITIIAPVAKYKNTAHRCIAAIIAISYMLRDPSTIHDECGRIVAAKSIFRDVQLSPQFRALMCKSQMEKTQ